VKVDIGSEEFERLPLFQKLVLIEERKREIYKEIENIFSSSGF
jgi:hypothetical protein